MRVSGGATDATAAAAILFPVPAERDAHPILLVARRRGAVVWANTAARALFGEADESGMSRLLFEAGPASRALAVTLRMMLPGEEPRLERLRLGRVPSAVPHLVLCRVADEVGPEPLAVLEWAVPAPSRMPRPASAPATQLAAPDDVAPVSASADRTGLRRALWTADRAGVVTGVDPGLSEILGRSALKVGDHVAARLRTLAPALAAAVEVVLAQGGSVPATRVAWPRGDGEPLSIEIGCARRRGSAGELAGYCVLHRSGGRQDVPSTEMAVQARPEGDDEPSRSDPDDIPASPEAAALDRPPDPLVAATPDRLPAPEPLAAFAVVPASPGSNVLHFPAMRVGSVLANFGPEMRTLPTPQPPAEPQFDAAELEAPRWSEDPDGDGSAGGLSADERDAFEEIGQVLGTRPSVRQAGPGEQEVPAPNARIVLEALIPFFDSLPFGLLWQLDGATGANRNFRERSGFAADPLPVDLVPEDMGSAAVRLTGRNGTAFEARACSSALLGSTLRWFILPETTRPPDHALATSLTEPADVLSGTTAIDIAADGHALLDDTGRITRISAAGARLFGRAPADLVGRPLIDLAAPDDEEAWKAVVSAEQPGAMRQALFGRTPDGQAVPLVARVGRIAANGLFVALTDDAERYRASTALDAARKEAERTSALKSEFLARVSHEIRTPLNAILGFAEVIRDERLGPVGNNRYLDYMRDIHASGTHVMSLVNDLLDLSRIEAGRMDLRLEAVDANAVVNTCVNTLQQQATRERVVLRLSLTPHLPAALADERSLRQIVLNLLSNAIKFNEPGGQVIVSTAAVEPDAVAIRIRDTGIGMTDGEIEIAMEPFRQVSAVRRAGSGLGLPVTKALVEANCASMTIRSKPGQGTLVEVTFPMVEHDAMSLPAE